MTRALFLDRDGVVNVDKAYVYKKDEMSGKELVMPRI